MSKYYVSVLPVVIGNGATQQFYKTGSTSHYTNIDEGIAAANEADSVWAASTGVIEEFLLASGILTGTPGNITEFRLQFVHEGRAGSGQPTVTFEIFVKQTSGGSFVQVGESKTVNTFTDSVVTTHQITWLDSDSTPFIYSAEDWASAYQRKIKMTATTDAGGTPTPDTPAFQYVG